MSGFWSFLRGQRPASAPAPSAPVAAAPADAVAHAPSEAPPPTAATTPDAPIPLEPRALGECGLPQPFEDVTRAALRSGARAIMVDPEEFGCCLCLLFDDRIEAAAECPLELAETLGASLEQLDRGGIEDAGVVRRVQIYTAVTDLGRRIIVQLFEPGWDEEAVTERRKANVRAINRLRPGTSLTRHNRARLLTALARASAPEGPSFLERLRAEGVSVEGDDAAAVIREAVLPRKAVARALGAWLEIPFVDVEEELPRGHARLFERAQILAWEAICCGEDDDVVVVAMADPTDAEAVAAIQAHLGRPVRVRVAAATDIRVAADKLFRPAES